MKHDARTQILADLRGDQEGCDARDEGAGSWPVACLSLLGRWRRRALDPRLAAACCTAALATTAAGAETPEQEQASDLQAAIDAYLEPLVESGLFSGSVLLAQNDEVLYHRAHGLAHVANREANRTDSGFKLMSVTKPLTALAVLREHEASGGRLLDRPVADLLKPWPEVWSGVTVRHLMQHTSGIPNFELAFGLASRSTGQQGLELWPKVLERVDDRAPRTEPGRTFAYSNTHFCLLALVLESVTGKPFERTLAERVLEPARMQRTRHDDGSRPPGLAMGYFRALDGSPQPSVQDMSDIRGAGDLISTTGDLYRLDRALASGRILKPATLQEIAPGSLGGYSLGWVVGPVAGQPCVHHSGGSNGYVANYLRFSDSDACVVVLSNLAYAPSGRIGEDLAALLFGQPVKAPRTVPAERLAGFAGVYCSPKASQLPILVERSGATLMVYPFTPDSHRVGGQLLMPMGAGNFALPHSSQEYSFRIAGDAAGSLMVRQGSEARELARSPVLPWDGIAGEYRVAQRPGAKASIERRAGGLFLAIQDVWPESIELVPLGPSLGYARGFVSGGSKFHLVHGPSGALEGFRWRDLSGFLFTGTKVR